MNAHSPIEDQLADAWQKLQEAHIMFEGALPGTKEYKQRWGELIEAIRKYNRVVQRMDPAKQNPKE